MTAYWAVLLDETGCEFGAGVTATDREAAYDYLRENYPESRVVQLESPQDRAARQQRLWDEAERAMYGDYYPDDYYGSNEDL